MLNHVGGLMICLSMFGQSDTKRLECLWVVKRPSLDSDSLSRFQFTVNRRDNRPQIIMASSDGQQKTSEQLLCSQDITRFHRWAFISVNSFLSVTASLRNALILIALRKDFSLRATVQTLASFPCNHWSLCWSYFRASCCYVLDLHNEQIPNWKIFPPFHITITTTITLTIAIAITITIFWRIWPR